MNKKQIAITLGCICCILTMAIYIQIKTIDHQGVGQSFEDDDLRDQVLKWKEKYDTTYSNLQSAEKNLENIRDKATKNTDGSADKEAQLKQNNMIIGLTDVTGEGVVVTMKDNNSVTADSISASDNISLYLVHDADIRTIVNELENAGAEAISINDQRVVSTTAITCEGNVISVNGEKVSSPFIIKGIGNSLGLYSALMRPGGNVETFNKTGIITTVKQSSNVNIAKYAGAINSKYAKYAK